MSWIKGSIFPSNFIGVRGWKRVEYGLRAVVGAGYAPVIIKTGDKIKVDGNTGIAAIARQEK